MVFVIKQLSKQEQKKYLPPELLERSLPPSRMVLCEESGSYMYFSRGIGRGEASVYNIHIGGEIVKVTICEKSITKDLKGNYYHNVKHRFHLIEVPKQLSTHIQDIKKLAKAFLEAWGWNANPERTGEVSFEGLETVEIKEY